MFDMESRVMRRLRTITVGARANGLLLYLALALSMLALLALYFVLRHKAFAFVDIGSDLFFQFYPLQMAEARQLRDLHELTWSFDIGLGAYIGSDFDPIQLLAALFPDSWQLAVRLPIYLLKLVLGGAFFLAYLRKVGFAPMLAVIGAMAYTFSSYNIVNGQWDPNGLVSVQLAAYLFFLEAALREERKHWAAVAAGATVGLGQAFDVYTFSLLTTLYILARHSFYAAGAASYWKQVARCAGWASVGFLLTAPMALPNLHYLFDSPRVSGSYSLLNSLFAKIFQLNDRVTLGAEAAGFFGKDLLGTGDAYRGWANYFEGPGFYVGILLLLCIPQLLAPSATRREKRLCLAGFGLLIAYMFWPAMRFAVYGFGHVVFRVSTLWITAGLIVLGLAGLRRAMHSGVWRTGLILASCVVFGLLALITYRLAPFVNVAQVLRVAAFGFVYVGVLGAARQRAPAASTLLIIFACELLLFSAPGMIERTAVDADGSSAQGSYNDGTTEALAEIRRRENGAEFYRVEKTYNSVFLCDALVQGYSGVKSYFFHGSSLSRFVDKTGIERIMPGSPNYIGSGVNRPPVLDVVGVKYLLSRNRAFDGAPGFEYLFDAGGISVYRNTDDLGFAHLHQTLTSEAEADSLPVDQRLERMRADVVVADPASVRSELDALAAHADTHGVTSAYAVLRRVSDIELAGDVSSPDAAVLLVAMPYDPGWSARLDDVATSSFVADYGLTGILVPPGLHTLHFNFRPPGRTLGNWLALASFGFLLVPVLARNLRRFRATPNDRQTRASASTR